MKNTLLLLLFTMVFSISCNAKKTLAENTDNPASMDNSLVINDTITVNNGKLITTTNPLPKVEKDTINVAETLKQEADTANIAPAVIKETEKPTPVSTEVKNDVEVTSNQTPFSHDIWNSLLTKHVTKSGVVNYNGFKKDRKKLLEYLSLLSENLPNNSWSKEEKLSYWMNAYNAMTVDLILRNLPLQSIKDIKKPWDQRIWKLGNKYYNLDEIEHQILRKMDDPRIHFGINCASFSCPPLLNEAFIPSKVNKQLDTVATTFINDSTRNKLTANSVEISKIFDWFAKDFKTNGSIINYLNKYASLKISEDAKVRYMDYNWDLNN